MFDFRSVHSILVDRAVRNEDISYSELFQSLGMRFSRPKVRGLCKLLGEIDSAGIEDGDSPLAVFVVRSSDRLPGEGWWESRSRYHGPRDGEQAKRYVKRLQRESSRYWKNQ